MNNYKELLIKNIEELEIQLNEAKLALRDFESDIKNHTYNSFDEAESYISELLYGRASDDCEGSYNCGDEFYYQEFIVDDVKYLGKIEVEYNRHDKTYYYVDGFKWSYERMDDVTGA